jgi:hypothetical protein
MIYAYSVFVKKKYLAKKKKEGSKLGFAIPSRASI